MKSTIILRSLISAMNDVLIPAPRCLLEPLNVPSRLLLGPGPSNVADTVLNAMNHQMLGYLHPEFLKVMDDVKAGLQYAFQTNNELTLAISGTGHAGMEAALCNLVEPGDNVLILENGLWGQRAGDMAQRIGGNVENIVQLPGEVFSLTQVEQALKKEHSSVVFVCHGESSTGVLHPLEGLAALCHQHNALLIVDTVASLGAAPFNMDQLEVDCVYSATQKALSCPPGLAPISFSQKAVDKILSRKTKTTSFYLDMKLVGNYWGCFPEPRKYHHTGMISLVYALRQALANLAKEGLNNHIQRHVKNAQLLHENVNKIGLKSFVNDPNLRAPTITSICVPDGVNPQDVVSFMLKQYEVEIAQGLGPTAGKIWRVGLMGNNSTTENVELVTKGLREALNKHKL